MPLPDLLPIPPFTRPARGDVVLPGSKSLTNRALLLAALCDGPVTLTGALFSEDTRLMIAALRTLGFAIEADETQHTLQVTGRAGRMPAETARLHVGLAGTAARFLTALCAAAPRGTYHLDGVEQMRKRPMKGLIDALRAQGAVITCTGHEGFFPFTIEAHGLRGGEVDVDASESSQILSALFMVAPFARATMWLKPLGGVRAAFVNMTKNLMGEFGVGVTEKTELYSTGAGPYRSPGRHAIEPDATAASYFLALPLAATGSTFLPALRTDSHSLQGDARFADVLRAVGGSVAERKSPDPSGLHPPQVLGVESSFAGGAKLRGVTQNFHEISDTFLTLAALGPLLDGPTRITGIAHTRKQETDRVAGMARELTKLGQHVVEEPDALTITPRLDELKNRAARGPIEIETYGDHRFAMSFAILGCRDLLGEGRPWLAIRNPGCCAKTFPNFFDVLEAVREGSLAA